MGILDFAKDSGRDLGSGDRAQEIRKMVDQSLGDQLTDLNVSLDPNGTVHLSGKAKWFATRQKAALLAGNIKGVSKVDVSGIVVDKSQQATEDDSRETALYTIQSGDTLSKIAQRQYGDANQWRKIFEANRGVIEDPDKIFPGQQIRLPN